MKNTKFTFIGCGNMARSLIGGLIANGINKEQLIATDPDIEQRSSISEQFGITTLENNNDASFSAEIL